MTTTLADHLGAIETARLDLDRLVAMAKRDSRLVEMAIAAFKATSYTLTCKT